MKPKYLRVLLTLGMLLPMNIVSLAQEKLPVIRSGKSTISIRDGKDLNNGSWTLTPALRPDTYFTQAPRSGRRITFITDQDSISFLPEYGRVYDFIILLNGKDSCRTRVSANYEAVLNPIRITKSPKQLVDTLLFFMKNSRLYFKGKLNGHKDVVMMFDFGAGMTCLSKQSPARSGLKFDGSISVQNSDGTHNQPSSSKNLLEIAGLRWAQVPLVQVANLDDAEDMIIGNALFRDKIVEIDYEKKIMIISDRITKDLSGYTAHDVIYYQDRPRFEVQVKVGSRYYPFHFLFDTGRDGTMLIGDDFTNQYNLWDKYRSVIPLGKKKIVVVPEVKIGNRIFRNIVTNANNPKYPNPKQSLLGNEILNQFNLVLDNRNAVIYLKPNGLHNEDYATYAEFKLQLTGLVVIAILVLLGGILAIRIFRVKKQDR